MACSLLLVLRTAIFFDEKLYIVLVCCLQVASRSIVETTPQCLPVRLAHLLDQFGRPWMRCDLEPWFYVPQILKRLRFRPSSSINRAPHFQISVDCCMQHLV